MNPMRAWPVLLALLATQAFANLQLDFPATKLGTGPYNVVGNISADAITRFDGVDQPGRRPANVIYAAGSPLAVSLIWAYDPELEDMINEEGVTVSLRDLRVYLTCPSGSPQLTYARGVNNSYTYNVGVPFPTNLPTSMPIFATLECGSPPACSVSTASLDFGTTTPGTAVERTFTITNSGGGTLTGEVTESCAEYSVTNGAYSLAEGLSQTITVTYNPAAEGSHPCALDTGGSCADISMTGTAAVPPACQLSANSADFGVVGPDVPVTRTFTVTNVGGGTLSGEFTEECFAYTVTDGAYSLGAGQSQTVTILFQTGQAGTFECTLEGDSPCGNVSLTGTVEMNPPVCALDVDSLDFGTTFPATPVERSFTITNTGGGTLAGSVTETCDAYTVSNGVYSLAAGQSQLVVVMFQSAAVGDFPCILDTGSSCADLNLTASVEPVPACQLSASAVDLGLLLPGEIAMGSYTLTNVGGGTLSGTASMNCEHFTFTGPVDFALTAGQSQTFTFDFFSNTPDEYTCRITTGTSCGQVQVTAAVQSAPQCVVGASLLDFGTTTPGAPVVRTFTIGNAGGHTLSGEVTESCAAYTVSNGAYSLGMGESQTVTVTLQSATPGDFPCVLDTGGACDDVTLAGTVELAPACQLSASTVDLGLLLPGEIAMGSYTLTNVGGGTLSGTAGMDCDGFTFTGPVDFALGAGQSQTFTFDFFSAVLGEHVCAINTGTSCGDVQVTALVQSLPQCQVSASSLDFGTVQPGIPAEQSFTITNVGGHTLSGTVVEDCADFSLVGTTAYNLTAGQSQTFTVRFQAAETGDYSCQLDSGADCADIALSAVVDPLPACDVSVAALDFGTTFPGTPVTRTFSITNTGGGLLVGAVLESCAAYSVSGGAYSLAAGQSQTVTVTFQSATSGEFPCTLDTGASCADIAMTGTVELAPACQVNPTTLNFGTTTPGTPVTRTFTITNTGGGLLEGEVTETCDSYSVTNGNYSLATGQSHVVSVTLQSATEGTYLCVVETGSDCADVQLEGAVANPPVCQLSVTGLDFGTLLPGTTAERSFTITNVGGGVLTGVMAETCPAYNVANGTYSLAAGQSQTVTVTFQSEASGSFPCVLDTGGSCSDLGLVANVAALQLSTGEASECGVVEDLGHLPGATTGFVQDWENGDIGIILSNLGGGTLTVSVVVDDGEVSTVWSGPVGTGYWEADDSDVDLEDWFGQDVAIHLELSDGIATWNAGGVECLWDLSFLDAEVAARPLAYLLHEAAPNPFNPVTRLRLDMPESGHVRMAVRDLQGRLVELLVDGQLAAGAHELSWQPGEVASGTYFVVVESRMGVQVRKVLFLK
jgi:hypothetical protein